MRNRSIIGIFVYDYATEQESSPLGTSFHSQYTKALWRVFFSTLIYLMKFPFGYI